MAGGSQASFPAPVCPRAHALAHTPKRSPLLSRPGVSAHLGPPRLCARPAANLFRPLADRSQPPGRERYSGRRTGAVMEPHLGSQTAGLRRGRLQCSALGRTSGLRSCAWTGFRTVAPMASEGETALLPGSSHTAATGNGRTPRNARSPRLEYNSSSAYRRCGRLKNVETPVPGLKPRPTWIA